MFGITRLQGISRGQIGRQTVPIIIEVIRLRPLPERAIAPRSFWVARTRVNGADACLEAQLAVLMAVGRKYSGYYEQLKDDVKKRHHKNLERLWMILSYTFSSGLGIDVMPNIEYPNIYTSQGGNSQETWCYCKTEESGTMILCENNQGPIKWFHVECLRITNIPKKKWFCPECRKETKINIKKNKSH